MFLLAGNGAGHLLRMLWRGREEPVLDRFVLDTAMGLGVVSLAMFGLAASGHLTPCWVETVFMCVAGAVGLAFTGYDVANVIGEWLKNKRFPSIIICISTLLLICIAVLVLIPAMAPPSGSDWDSLAYHLSIPKLYLQHGGFYYIDWSSHSNFPFLVEMLYTPALAQEDPVGAKMVHYLYGVLLVLSVVALVRKHFDSRAAPLAALALVSVPMVLWEATTAYIDLATALYTIISVYLLLDYLDNAKLRSLIGCGIAAGFAASTKMTGLALIPLLVLWLVIDRWFATRRVEWKRALAFCGVGFLVCSPWYIKTLIYTGNPVYPFFYSIFGGRDWTAELAHTYTVLQSKFGVGHDISSFLMLPWNLAIRSESFNDWYGLFVGPIVLVGAPMLLLARYRSRKLLGLTLFFFAQMLIWFKLSQQSRYLIPTLAILAVIIASVAYSDERFRVTRRALYVTFAVSALFAIYTIIPLVRSAAPVVFGSETKEEYLTRTLSIYPADDWINENAPKTAKIALFGDTRGFYLNRSYVWADPGHNRRFTRDFDSTGEFISCLKRQGITYAIIDYDIFAQRKNAAGTAKRVYEAIDSGRFEPVPGDESGRVVVYKIR